MENVVRVLQHQSQPGGIPEKFDRVVISGDYARFKK